MPAAKPGKTLPQRSQQILGVDLDADLDPGKDLSSDNRSKRREQLARAQQKHRKRTQKYIIELEAEVIRLHKSDEILRQRVKLLEALLASKDVKPSESTASHQNRNTPSFRQFEDTSSDSPVAIDLSILSHLQAEVACCITAAEETPPERPGFEISPASHSVGATAAGGSIHASNASDIAAVLTPSAAVGFILRLEKPCLPHLKFSLTEDVTPFIPSAGPPYNFGPAHYFNLSTALVHAHQSQNPMEDSFTISEAQFVDLFDASCRLNLDDEVTPVQVWAAICELLATISISHEMLETIAEQLSSFTYCNSFGTAIDKSTASAIFQEVLGTSNI